MISFWDVRGRLCIRGCKCRAWAFGRDHFDKACYCKMSICPMTHKCINVPRRRSVARAVFLPCQGIWFRGRMAVLGIRVCECPVWASGLAASQSGVWVEGFGVRLPWARGGGHRAGHANVSLAPSCLSPLQEPTKTGQTLSNAINAQRAPWCRPQA